MFWSCNEFPATVWTATKCFNKKSRGIIRGTMGHTTVVAFFKESRHVDISNPSHSQQKSLEKKQFMNSHGCWCGVTGMLPLVDMISFPTVAIFCCRHHQNEKTGLLLTQHLQVSRDLLSDTSFAKGFRKKDSRKRCHSRTRLLCSQKKKPYIYICILYIYVI